MVFLPLAKTWPAAPRSGQPPSSPPRPEPHSTSPCTPAVLIKASARWHNHHLWRTLPQLLHQHHQAQESILEYAYFQQSAKQLRLAARQSKSQAALAEDVFAETSQIVTGHAVQGTATEPSAPHLAKGASPQLPRRAILAAQDLNVHGGDLPVVVAPHEGWQRACVPRVACLQRIHGHAAVAAHLT